MSHTDLFHMYQVMFEMSETGQFSVTELENMYPYERDLYYELMLKRIKEKAERKQHPFQ